MTTWAFVLRPYRSTRDLVDTVTELSQEVRKANGRIRELETEGAIQRGMVRQVENKLTDLQYDFSELRAGAARLIDQIVNEYGGFPVWQIPKKFEHWTKEQSVHVSESPVRAAYRVIGELFDNEELRELIFEIGVDWDDLPGVTRRDKIRNLVERVYKNGRLEELVSLAKEKRPGAGVDWLGL